MVNRAARILFAAWLMAPLAAFPAEIPAHRLGDIADKDVIAPFALAVLNPEATEALREKEAQKVPAVVRIRAQAGAEAEGALRAAIDTARGQFNEALRQVVTVSAAGGGARSEPAYQRAVEDMRRKGADIPILEELALLWAREEGDTAVQDRLAERLRATMRYPIMAGPVPEMFNPTNALHWVTVRQFDEPVTAEDARRNGRIQKGGPFHSLTTARAELMSRFRADDRKAAEFAARFLITNAVPDVELTRILRARQTEGLRVVDQYQPGEIVVRAGQVVDRKALAALNAFREENTVATLRQRLDRQQQSEAAAANVTRLLENLQHKLEQKQSEPAAERTLFAWLGAGFGVVIILLGIILWRIRTRPRPSLLPALGTADMEGSDWRDRALAAEARVVEARAVVKNEFMQWMREKFVHELFQQRAELLSAQQRAEVEMRALVGRLEQLQAPLKERIAAYETRIVELERELAAKGEENRELIKAKITLAKHQLSLERERGGSRFGIN